MYQNTTLQRQTLRLKSIETNEAEKKCLRQFVSRQSFCSRYCFKPRPKVEEQKKHRNSVEIKITL